MPTTFRLPRRIHSGNNIHNEAELIIREGKGVYVYLTRLDNNVEVELPEEGSGEPEALPRIISHARANRRRYVEERIEQALADEWSREQLGLPACVEAE